MSNSAERRNDMYKRMIIRRFLTASVALLFLFVLSGCLNKESEAVYMNINAEKAKEMMESMEEFVILDARSEAEFAEGHIPGAIVIPHDEISEKAEEEILDKDIPIFVYCRSGRRSKIAAKELLDLGYSEIYEFGGINDWPYEIEK